MMLTDLSNHQILLREANPERWIQAYWALSATDYAESEDRIFGNGEQIYIDIEYSLLSWETQSFLLSRPRFRNQSLLVT